MEPEEIDIYQTEDRAHGREESRTYFVIKNPEENWQIMEEWAGSKRICVSMNMSRAQCDNGSEVEVKYYLTSSELTAQQFGEAARMHWEIEANLHWCLDTAFKEDASKVHVENAAENMATLRRAAINMLKRDDSIKASLSRKLRMAALDETYLSKLLVGQGVS